MITHDLICNRCELISHNMPVDSTRLDDPMNPYKCTCGGLMEIYYSDWRQDLAPGSSKDEKVILYQSTKEGGRIQYPGRGDVPVPSRLAARGYQKIELNVRDLASFEKKHHVANERRHFNRNGNGF